MQNSAAPQKRKQKEKSGVLRLREINATVTFIFAFSVFALFIGVHVTECAHVIPGGGHNTWQLRWYSMKL